MKLDFRLSLLILCGLLFLPQECKSAEVLAGVGQERFTLPDYVPLAGYSRRKGAPSSGMHDPVGVRAVVVQDEDTIIALISCDLLIVNESLFESVHKRLSIHGIPDGIVLMLAASHTHSGPGSYGRKYLEKLSMGHFSPQAFEAIAETITKAVVQAHSRMVPVRITYRTASLDGLITNRIDADEAVDEELVVCAIYANGDSNPIAVIVNFAAHPTTLGAWNTELSGDYPGIIMSEVEQSIPGVVCLFFAGAVGDQAPVKEGNGFEPAERLGHYLAKRVLELINKPDAKKISAVWADQEEFALPPARIRLGRLALPQWLSARFADDDATLTVVVAGQVMFIGVPCDLTSRFGIRLKQVIRDADFKPVIAGFANDYIGYCIPESLYGEGIYESSMAFNGPETGKLIVDRLEQMVSKIAVTTKLEVKVKKKN